VALERRCGEGGGEIGCIRRPFSSCSLTDHVRDGAGIWDARMPWEFVRDWTKCRPWHGLTTMATALSLYLRRSFARRWLFACHAGQAGGRDLPTRPQASNNCTGISRSC